MALRSLLLSLRLRRIGNVEGSFICRGLSSGALPNELIEDNPSLEIDDLKSRILRLRFPKRSATDVIQKWINEGNTVRSVELREIAKELRRSQCYKHALEISEWMVSHEEFQLSDSDFADRIDLMTKVFGIDAAERYFHGLPASAKTCETYTALLHSYAAAKFTERAEELYGKMKEANLALSALAYNEMMTLYMSVGQVEKVPSVVQDLKCQNIAPDLFTYNLWISSCAATMDMDGVQKILTEMSSVSSSNESWGRYVNLVNIYITTGNLVNSETGSVVEAEKGITQREWITYDFLVILQAGLGNKLRLDQIWQSLRMTKQKMISRNFICVLASYLILDHLKEVGKVVDQWKESTTTQFDISICNKLLGAFEEHGLHDKAINFRSILVEKSCYTVDE